MQERELEQDRDGIVTLDSEREHPDSTIVGLIVIGMVRSMHIGEFSLDRTVIYLLTAAREVCFDLVNPW